jgi:hypothetical protein
VNRERLKLVIEALEATDDRAFDMAAWARKTECGTVGCAVGQYIAHNPECGLELRFHRLNRQAEVYYRWPSLFGWRAISEHFELAEADSQHLFYVVEYASDRPTRQEVIDRIRKFIGEDAAPVVELKARAMATVPG